VNAPAKIERTPAGRIPGEPLKDKRRERLAYELACGHRCADACKRLWDEGIKILNPSGTSFTDNARRLSHDLDIRERVEEIALMEAATAGIYPGWVLGDMKFIARGSMARFWRRTQDGKLDLDRNGHPIIDLRHANEEDFRLIQELSYSRAGPKLKLHDMPKQLENIARHLGLLKDQGVSFPDLFNEPIEIRLVAAVGARVEGGK
jgi:hypothetical protein